MKEEFTDEIKQDKTNSEQELFEHHRFVVDKGQSLMRIDKYLVNIMADISRSRIQNAAEAGNIRVNDKPIKSSYKVKPGDIITIVLSYPPSEFVIVPQNIPINIVYEDDDIILINKSPGVVVHPGFGNYDGTLLNAIAYHLRDYPDFDPNDPSLGLVHRIDKNTSGLLLVAKTKNAKIHLGQQFYEKTIKRRYYAIVWGNVKEDEGTITGDLARDPNNRMLFKVFPDGENPMAKHAVTHYRVIERFGYATLLECHLETGRTHQIRVHMKHIGHTLFNDDRYGGNVMLKGSTSSYYKLFIKNCFFTCPRQALHAKTLGFVHPSTEEYMYFDSDLPDDIQQLINKWRGYSQKHLNMYQYIGLPHGK